METKHFVWIVVLTTFAFLTMICSASTVLQVIPSGSTGWVEVNNLGELTEKIDAVIQKFTIPEVEMRQGIILMELSRILPFSKIIDNVPELEEHGLDAKNDFSIFWIDVKPLCAIHIKDKAKLELSLQNRTDLVNIEYQGTLYKKSDKDIFVILGDVLVCTQQSETGIQRCIETYTKAGKSLLEDPNYIDMDNILKSKIDDVKAYFVPEDIAGISNLKLKAVTDKELQSIKQGLESLLWDQIESVTVSIILDKQSVKMEHILSFKKDSYMRKFMIAGIAGSSEFPPKPVVVWRNLSNEVVQPIEFDKVIFADDFDQQTLQSDWNWIDPNDDCTKDLSTKPGWLRIYAPNQGYNANDLWSMGNTDCPRLLVDATGNFVVETRIGTYDEFFVGGLLIWADKDNFIRFERGTFDPNKILLSGNFGGQFMEKLGDWSLNSESVHLRILRKDGEFKTFFSEDGSKWNAGVALILPVNNPLVGDTIRVGIHAISSPNGTNTSTYFDYFRLIKLK